ncbi:hypothetical protein [Pseudoteredinibacter isoporae]|uniref:hypothetical protein n=1 Tax=Pseudoteredinibacter isoporae TaxID=570281 RepID=UPI003107B3D7
MNHTQKYFSRVTASNRGPRRTLALAVGIAQFFMLSGATMQAMAAPTGGQVVQGEGFITQGQHVTNVHQNTDLMTVQWDSFDLNQQEVVNFLQPGSHAWVLNHILQNGPSHIDGRINANGNVLLINPRGMIFGDNALINAGSFTASSLWLDKDDFLNGDFYFKDIDATHGRIVNHGVIAAATGGFINLIGESISNEGLLSANMGYVSVAAGSEVFLSFDDNNFLGVKVNKDVVNNDPGLQAAIENKGRIEAGTGKVMMNAQSARDLFSQAVNHSGVIEANGFGAAVDIQANGAVQIEGDIRSNAGEQGGSINIDAESIALAGTLSANGDRGGQVHLRAEHIGLEATASIDVSGKFGGGQALIGGAYQGADPTFRNAQTLYVADGATIYANAIENGNGGEVILWSDLHTHFYGNVFARGGRSAGNGGFVETSGKQYISLGGFVNTLAPNGQAGTWLLDPTNMTIDDAGSGPNNLTVAQLLTNLQGGNFQISTAGAGADAGDISILSAIDFSSEALTMGNSLTLIADNNIIVDASVSLLGDFILNAQNAIQINQNITTTANLSLTMVSYTLDPAAVLSVTSGLAFNYLSGDQSLDLTALAADLTNVSAGTYTFDLGSGGTDVLTGTATDDSFTLNSANSIQANVGGKSVRFDGVEQLDGSTGSDTIDLANSGASISASGYTSQGIAVSNVLQTSNTGALTGTSSDESFDATSANTVAVAGLSLGGVSSVAGGGGNDQVNLNNTGATLNSGGFNGQSIDFSAVNTVSNTGALSGSSSDENFDASSANTVTVAGVNFSSVSSVAGGGGTDSANLNSAGATLNAGGFNAQSINFTGITTASNTVTLTGTSGNDGFALSTANNVTTSGTTFSGVNTVAGGGGSDAVNGSGSDENFDATGANAVTVAGINFSSISTVTGGGGADSVDLNTAGATLSVGGFTGQSINFSDIDAASNTGALTGTSGDDDFDLSTANNVSSSGTTFSGVSTVAGGGGSDTVNGSTFDETFDATAANAVTVAGINFTAISAVTGGGGTGDQVNLNGGGADISASGFDGRGISFSNVRSVTNTDTLTGTTSDDSFRATADNQITVNVSGNDVQFANVNSVDGNGGTDSVDIENQNADLSATGFNSRSIAFSDVDTVSNTNQLLGTASDESFTVTAMNSVSVNPGSGTIEFQDVNQVNGNTGSDSVDIGSNGASLNGAGFSSHGVNFVQVATASNTGQITGQSGDDNFSSASSGNISVSGVNFSGVSAVDGNGGNDDVSLNSANANLNSTGFSSNAIDFSDIDSALDTGELTATSDPEVFQINGDGSITVSGIRFAGVTVLDGGEAGDDSDEDRIVGNVNSFQVAGDESAVVTTAATSFTANNVELLESSNNTADLIGQNGVNDQFLIEASRQISTQGMRFSGLDLLTAQAEDNVNAGGFGATLSATGFTSQNVDVNGAGSVSNTGALTGSNTDDSFRATSSNQITVEVSGADIQFANVNSVSGGGGTDSADIFNEDASMTASGFDSRGVSFSAIATVNNTDVLTGRTSNDAFRATANNEITVDIAGSDVQFSGVATVNGGGGTDSVDLNNTGATLNAGGFNGRSINFNAVNTVSNTGALSGSSADESFDASSANTVTVASVNFSSVSSVAGGGGTDSVDLNSAGATLNAGGFNGQSINFTDIDATTNTNALTGTSGNDSFSTSASNSVTVSGTSFAGVNTVTGGGGNDSADLNNGSATLNGSGFDARSITFNGVVSALNTGTLNGTSNDESFDATSANTIGVTGLNFAGVSAVAGGGGNDQLNLNNAGATLNAGGFNGQSINFSAVNTVSNTGALSGSSADESFDASSANTVTVAGVNFSSVSSVAGGGGTDSVDLNGAGATLNAGGFNGQSINFTDIDATTNTNTLTGTSGNDSFSASASNSVTVSGTSFAGVNTVTGGGGNDSADLNNGSATLNGSGFDARSITFNGVASALNTGTLNGTSNDESFDATSANTIAVAGLNFAGVSAVAGGGGNDQLNLNNAGATLNAGGFNGRSINFSAVNTVSNTGALSGSSADENFDASSANTVTVAGVNFSSVSSVAGGGGTDSVDLNSAGATLNAGGFNGQSINFTDIDATTNTNALTGTSGNDSFSTSASNSVTVSGTSFAGVNTVTGGGGNDSADLNNGSATLNGSGFDARSITFNGVASALNTGTLNGTSNDENFDATSANTIAVAGLNFAGVSAVAGGGGNDQLNLNNAGATLNAGGFNGQSINFSAVNTVSNTGALSGSSADENFDASSANTVTVAGVNFSSVNSVAGGGGTDSVDLNGAGATLNAGGFNGQSINFSDIDSASNTVTLTGSSGNDDFDLSTANNVTSSGTTFSGVNTVVGGGGSDTVNGSASDESFNATAANAVTVSGINFSSISAVTGGGGTDSVNLNGTAATLNAGGFSGQSMNFSDIDSALNTPSLTGTSGDDGFDLSSANNVTSSGTTFSGVSSVAGGGGSDTVNGSASNESFDAAAANAVTVAGINFTSISAVNGGGGTDSVNVNGTGATLNAGGFNSQAINFSDIDSALNTVTLTGSSGDDSFDTAASNSVTASGTVFSGVNTVNGGGGNDSVDINNGSATLMGSGFDSRSMTFSGVNAVLNTDTLTGTASNENFNAATVNNVAVGSLNFAGVNAVAGGGGNDQVDLNSAGATLLASGFRGQAIDFTGVAVASNTGALTGTNAAESFDASSANAIAVAGLNFTGVSSVDGSGGVDSVDLHDASATLQSGGGFDGQSINFENVETSNNTGDLIGSSTDDQFNLLGGRTISADWSGNGLAGVVTFNNVSSLDAAGGTNDSVLATSASDTFNLVASGSDPSGFANNQLNYQIGASDFILLANIEQVDAAGDFDSLGVFSTGIEINNGNNIVKGIELINFEAFSDTGRLALVGSSASDFFFIEGTGRVRSGNSGIIFTGVDSLVGDASLANTVNLGGGGASLAGTEFISQGINVSRINTIEDTGAITGSSEAYSLVGNQQVSVGNFSFSGVTSVSGGSSADLGNFAANLQGGSVIAAAVSFSGISVFSNISDLQGVTDFTITDQQAINASGFQFSGLTQVQAQTGSLSGRGAQLLANGQLNSSGIVFRGLQSVRDTGNLVGSDSDENFSLLPENTLSLSGINFTGVTGLDGAGGNDSINLNRLGVDLIEGGFTIGDFQILNIEQISETGELRGSDANESFAIQSDGRVSVSGFSFSDIDLISGGGGLDSLDLGQGGLSLLDGVELSSGGIRINGIEDFLNIAALELTDQDDTLSVIANDGFSLADYRFFGVQSIDGKAGNDQLLLDGQGLQLADGFAVFRGININNVERYAQVGNLSLNDLDNQITVNAVQGFNIDGIEVSDVLFIDAANGTDRLDAAGADSLLLDNGNLQVSGTELTNVELIDNSTSLTGSALADEFTLSDPGIVDVASYRFSGLTNLNGGAGQDRLILVNRDSVSLDFSSSSSGGVSYDGQSALANFSDIDLIRLPNTGQLTLNGSATLQVQDFSLSGALTLNDQVIVNAGGQSTIDGDLNVNDNSQFNTANNLQASGSLNTSGTSQVTVGGDVILGNGLNAGNSSVINVGANLSTQNEVIVQDDAQLVLGGDLATDNNLSLNDNAQLQVTGRIDVNGDLSALGQSNISTDSEINIVGQVNTSPTATINADSINLNVPEERVVTVQPEINISAAVFSEIKVFINSNSSVRNASETSGLYSDDDLVDALIESADETASTNAGGRGSENSAGSSGQE